AAVTNTRARLTGRPLSVVMTRPLIRPVGTGTASFACCAGVSRDGCCGPGRDWPPPCPACKPAARTTSRQEMDSARPITLSLDRMTRHSVGMSRFFHQQADPLVVGRFADD